jgi:hypothetical protein
MEATRTITTTAMKMTTASMRALKSIRCDRLGAGGELRLDGVGVRQEAELGVGREHLLPRCLFELLEVCQILEPPTRALVLLQVHDIDE